MDRNKAESMLTDARAELATAESAVLYLRQVVFGLEGLLKSSPAVASPVFSQQPPPELEEGRERTVQAGAGEHVRIYPRTPEAILEVLRSRPNYPMTFKEIWAQLADRDLIDPSVKSGRNAYSVSAARLALNGQSGVTRDERNRFAFHTPRPNELSSSSAEPGEDNNRIQLAVQS